MIWVNLITTSLRPNPGIMVYIWETIPKWPYFRLVNYYNLPRCMCALMVIYIPSERIPTMGLMTINHVPIFGPLQIIMGGVHTWTYPNSWMVYNFIMENPQKCMIWRYPHFRKHLYNNSGISTLVSCPHLVIHRESSGAWSNCSTMKGAGAALWEPDKQKSLEICWRNSQDLTGSKWWVDALSILMESIYLDKPLKPPKVDAPVSAHVQSHHIRSGADPR